MNRSPRQARALAVASAFALAAVLGACGDDDETPASTTSTTEASETSAAGGEAAGDELRVTEAWARTSPSMATAGAVYMVIENPTDTDDALVAAAVGPEVAGKVELHETKMADPGAGDDMAAGDDVDDGMAGDDAGDDGMEGSGDDDGGGMMTMSPVDQIPVPAGGTAVLEPGGFHIMMMGLAAPLEPGTTVEVTLTFENAGEVVVSADVRDTAP